MVPLFCSLRNLFSSTIISLSSSRLLDCYCLKSSRKSSSYSRDFLLTSLNKNEIKNWGHLRFNLLLVIILILHYDKKLFQKSGNTLQDIDIRNWVKSLNPFYENHLAILIFARSQFVADCVDELIKVKHETLIQRSVNRILENVIHLFGVVLHIIWESGSNEADNSIEDV